MPGLDERFADMPQWMRTPPQSISTRQYEVFLDMVRGFSTSTPDEWRLRLIEAGHPEKGAEAIVSIAQQAFGTRM